MRKRLNDEELGSIKGLEYEIASLKKIQPEDRHSLGHIFIRSQIESINEHIREIKGLKPKKSNDKANNEPGSPG